VDGDDSAATVVRAGEGKLKLKLIQPFAEGAGFRVHLGGHNFVGADKLRELTQVACGTLDLAPGRRRFARLRRTSHGVLRCRWVIPEAGPRRFLFNLLDFFFEGGYVKDAPLRG
jgi:hypothetical protein